MDYKYDTNNLIYDLLRQILKHRQAIVQKIQDLRNEPCTTIDQFDALNSEIRKLEVQLQCAQNKGE